MRNLRELDLYRDTSPEVVAFYGDIGGEVTGAFWVPSCRDRVKMRVVASADGGWDHVSVSRPDRDPTWREMEQIAKLFFKEGEHAMQLHVPASEHINVHKHCLHWWRPMAGTIPLPPSIFV